MDGLNEKLEAAKKAYVKALLDAKIAVQNAKKLINGLRGEEVRYYQTMEGDHKLAFRIEEEENGL